MSLLPKPLDKGSRPEFNHLISKVFAPILIIIIIATKAIIFLLKQIVVFRFAIKKGEKSKEHFSRNESI